MKLVLLDRDGVLNADLPTGVRHPDELTLLPGAVSALRALREAGIRTAVVTNQSVIGKGEVDEAGLARIHERLNALLAAQGASIDALYHCPAAPGSTDWRRKPNPGMLLAAMAEHGVTASVTPMVGDALRDMEAAAACGCPRFLVRTGKGMATEARGLPSHVGPVTVGDDLLALVPRLIAAVG